MEILEAAEEGAGLKRIAWQRRLEVLEMVCAAKAGHIGGSFSAMDILVTLYHAWFDTGKMIRKEFSRDRFVMSKGHCAEALYTVLAGLNFFPREELETYARFGTELAEHPTAKVPGVEMATGSLGHGLSIAVGMAYGCRQDGLDSKITVLMGDGEQEEGTVWEAAMAASKFSLDKLTAFIDRNGLQISGATEEVMPLESLEEKYLAFGWQVLRCDGHEPASILGALNEKSAGKPRLIIAKTVKGYGSAVLEHIAESHHMIPTEEQYLKIRADLASRLGI
ncbi:MAG: transketolase [Treponema sp.]|nr:transketolase [Treponema sp.]